MPKHSKPYLYWQAELIRMREAGGNINTDAVLKQTILEKYDTLDQRIIQRANLIAQQDQIQDHLDNWLNSAKLAIAVIWVLALFSGIGVAISTLAHNKINLSSALIAILGLHLVTFILWLLSYLPFVQTGSSLSKIWLWLSKYLSTKKSNQAGQALLNLFSRCQAWRPTIGIISHSTWLIALIGASISLLVLLSTKQYSFHWETTLLSAADFIQLTHILGSLPAILGFPIPDTNTISLSLTDQPLDQQLQSQWSVWLLGCIFVWGLLPRALALVVCIISLRRNLGNLAIDTNLPGWMQLRELLSPRHKVIGVDKPATTEQIKSLVKNKTDLRNAQAAIIGHELKPNTPWPPATLPANVYDLGTGSSRSDHKEIRNILKQHNLRLLLICNPELTPDRGAIAWFNELRENAIDLQILCGQGARTTIWDNMLSKHGFTQATSLDIWLNNIDKY